MTGAARIVGALALGMALGASAAGATMVTTGRLAPPEGGWLRCTVMNLAMKPLDFRLELRDVRGRIVTDFISFEWTDDEVVVARALAESYRGTPAYCRVLVGGGWRRDVAVTFEAFAADGTLVGQRPGR